MLLREAGFEPATKRIPRDRPLPLILWFTKLFLIELLSHIGGIRRIARIASVCTLFILGHNMLLQPLLLKPMILQDIHRHGNYWYICSFKEWFYPIWWTRGRFELPVLTFHTLTSTSYPIWHYAQTYLIGNVRMCCEFGFLWSLQLQTRLHQSSVWPRRLDTRHF